MDLCNGLPSTPRLHLSSPRARTAGITAAVAVSAAVTLWVPMEGTVSVQDLAYEATVDARGGRPSATESRDEAEVQAARQRAQWSERQGPRPTEGAGCTMDGFRVCSHQLLGYSAASAGARRLRREQAGC